ncbi:CopG family transcriptional regulator [Novosphingobium sp. Gsoil 351]|uniref:CopG family transcriptional regulator n=1 Tax=Novosphingobium sp. Gsoil 351 TaxID=2675225 RepID=UPI0012B4E556|nr:CopG family transcriptional regulator [Novosphingobium sp. Gsoil 351]QGN54100.1 CopG family transcriptional regulator [Novosphingobium sp. Gsoil 351]
MKVRQNLYLDRAVTDALEALASAPGTNKSRMVNDALAAWLARRASHEADTLFRTRLDRLSREIALTRRDLEVVLESLSLFIQHQLTVTAPLPEGDAAAIAVGRRRFQDFVAEVGRQIAGSRRALVAEASGDAG